MSRPWVLFTSSLEVKNLTFEDVLFSSDRLAVIEAAGITEPLAVAMIETEWQRRLMMVTAAHSSSPSASYTKHATNPSSSTSATPGAAAAAAVGRSVPDLVLPSFSNPVELRQAPEEIQDAVITREVLSAALGLEGNWIHQGAPSGEGFTLSRSIPSSMRGLCETVLPVADAFVALRKVEHAEYLSRSLVAMALGEVVSEVCSSYALEVSKLQQWSRDEPYGRSMPLMRVVTEITRIGYPLVRLRQVLPVELVSFDAAAAESSAVVSSSLSGARLLNHISDQIERCGGCKEESEILQLLLRRALVPYLRMMRRWLHEGVLEDPFGEFFITESASPTSLVTGGSVGSGVGGTQARNSTSFNSRHITEVFPDFSASSGGGRAPLYGSSTRLSHQEAVAFERRFSMNKLMIPGFLEKPSRIGRMIFFTGKYCCLLRECREKLPDFSSTTQVGVGHRESGTSTTSNTLDECEPYFVWGGVEDLHQKIQRSFELANQTVVQLMLSPAVDLIGHLTSIKNFYLHSRGDWVTDFLDNAAELLNKASDKVKGHTLRVLLQASIARCCTHDPYHDCIGCSFSDASLEQVLQRLRKKSDGSMDASGLTSRITAPPKVDAQRGIELLQLEADLKWPLTLILDPTVMARFNSIFRLLTWIKRCEQNLCSLWYTNEVLASFTAAYGIKHQLVQFLRQFQFFAAHFVLEPLWSRLMRRLSPADTIFSISQALNEFFTDAERGLTLSNASRFKSLSSVLNLAARFCDIGRHSSSATLPLIEATLHSVQDQYLTLLSELAVAVGPDYPQLVPLLTCIDFNGFYDRNDVYHIQSGVM